MSSSKAINNMGMGIVEPQERMHNLINFGKVNEIDPKQSIYR